VFSVLLKHTSTKAGIDTTLSLLFQDMQKDFLNVFFLQIIKKNDVDNQMESGGWQLPPSRCEI